MFPITCVVKYSVNFVTDGKYPFISDEDLQPTDSTTSRRWE